MKHFLLGTVFGAAAGFVFSCLTDSDGNRPGKPLKDEYDALKKAKQASHDLNEHLPEAERTISDMNDDFEKYSKHIQPIVEKMQQKSDELNQNLNNLDTKD